MQLELNNNDVYYVAPEFHTPDELNDAYVNRNVFDRSAFFSPLGIGFCQTTNTIMSFLRLVVQEHIFVRRLLKKEKSNFTHQKVFYMK